MNIRRRSKISTYKVFYLYWGKRNAREQKYDRVKERIGISLIGAHNIVCILYSSENECKRIAVCNMGVFMNFVTHGCAIL